MISANEKLRESNLFNNYKKLQIFYKNASLKKEKNQQNFLKKYLFCNEKTNERLTINYNFKTNYKKYIKSIEQKVFCIEELAKEENLIPLFITFTLPSRFHPFLSIKNNSGRLYTEINKNFNFETISD